MKVQLGYELNETGMLKTNTSSFYEFVMYSPYDIKKDLKETIIKEMGRLLNIDTFKEKFYPWFWNAIWYFKLYNLDYSMILSYKDNLKKVRKMIIPKQKIKIVKKIVPPLKRECKIIRETLHFEKVISFSIFSEYYNAFNTEENDNEMNIDESIEFRLPPMADFNNYNRSSIFVNPAMLRDNSISFEEMSRSSKFSEDYFESDLKTKRTTLNRMSQRSFQLLDKPPIKTVKSNAFKRSLDKIFTKPLSNSPNFNLNKRFSKQITQHKINFGISEINLSKSCLFSEVKFSRSTLSDKSLSYKKIEMKNPFIECQSSIKKRSLSFDAFSKKIND